MNMDNLKLILISLICIFTIVLLLYLYARGKKQVIVTEELSTFGDVLAAVKLYMVDLVKEDNIQVKNLEEYLKIKKIRAKNKDALKKAVYGIIGAKGMVQSLIRDFLRPRLTPEQIRHILGLDGESDPERHIKFEIIMYRYKQLYDVDALAKWILKNNYHSPRPALGPSAINTTAYYITKADLADSYYKENIILNDNEVYDLFAILLFQKYVGWGDIDTITEMNINGYNLGVSGSVMNAVGIRSSVGKSSKIDGYGESDALNSFWLFFLGVYIHFLFLEFNSEDEIRRIIQLLVRYNSPGPLSAKRGYLVNSMYDKSRILAIRPPAGEFWAAFVRKFTLDKNTPIDLIMKPGIHNGELPVKFTEFLMKGKVTAAITGRQGTGKTTFLKAIVTYIDPKLNLRVLEMAPEMYLRELFPDRNIFSVHEINTVSLEEWQDAFKKSDAGVTIIGEIATDPVAARAIQLAMTGSIFTIFTHHANEAKDLVLTLRNSLVNAAGFDNMTTAERQVTEVLKMNIHFDITPDGKRYIKRITEIIQMEESIPYPEIDPCNVELSLANATIEHYQRTTDRISFETKDLLVYDLETDTYKAKDMPSDYIIQKILNGLHKDEQNEFCKFIDYYWKDISTEGYAGVNYESEMEHKSMLTEEDVSEDEALENISAYLRDRFNFGDDEE